jgi:ketosteroid isomerase-like protein
MEIFCMLDIIFQIPLSPIAEIQIHKSHQYPGDAMKTLIRMAVIFSLLLVSVQCQKTINQEVEAMRLLKADWSFSEMSLEQGAAEAFKAYLADDAKLLPAAGEPIEGIQTIYEILKPGYEDILFKWEPEEAEVAASGDLGYTWGDYSMTIPSEGDMPYELGGKYVNVWRKNDRGEWRVIMNIGNQADPDEGI